MSSENTVSDKEHSTYSASGSHRWLNCPGSIKAAEAYGEQPSSVYADEGTRAHACMEFLLKNRRKFGAALVMAPKQFPDIDMVRYARDFAEYVITMEELTEGEVFIERRVDSSKFLGVPGQHGTCDVAIVSSDHLHIIDFKYGAGIVVEPREASGELNSQLAYYALGMYEEFPRPFITITVAQPRAYHASGETVRSVHIEAPELLAWRETFRRGVKRTLTEDPRRNSGDWCKFCPAKIDCPAVREAAFGAAEIVFRDHTLPATLPKMPSHDPDTLGRMLTACDRLEDWIKDVRAYALGELTRGRDVTGWKLVQKTAHRKWKDPAGAARRLKRALGSDVLTEPALLSPAQIEKKFPRAKEWLSKNTTKESSGVSMVPASDKRAAIEPTETVFGVIE